MNLAIKFFRYSLVGVVCTAIYFLAMFLCVEVNNIEPVLSSGISFLIMTIFSYMLNKKYTFGGSYGHKELIKFFIVASIGFVLNILIMYIIVTKLSMNYLISELVTILIIPLVNFILNNYWTFKSV
ncbi:GtrA family protein [Litchfieldia salsa]|uniref:Putative flippase GtrA (Transmembrane translocase of bactoprenol-linked glucose) n=1 Tax=Litchfieldia salsa TaxID=930152 RepID=A0A1H0T0P5_9BACI|nr:GtrA family protein [Litchfieldia salsa]SDP47385.1 Putative flippase GtrA (transmembrane translocase of bactoprenol-linked glucose) [Litchfieldia salsa]